MRLFLFFSLLMMLPLEAQDRFLTRAREIHKRAIVIDTHADTAGRLLDEGFDLGTRSDEGHIDLPRMRDGGLGAEFFSIWVSPQREAPHFLARGLAEIEAVLEQVDRHQGQLELARTAADIRRIHAAGKIAALMGLEGGHTIENNPRVLDLLYRLGVRYMTLTWANSTDWAGSSGDAGRERGLSEMGRQIVERMNRLGMMVDISHVSDPTFWDVLKVTRAPVIASHSSCRALCDNPRNLTDDMLRALAKNGGVAQINFYSAFIDANYGAAMKQLEQQYEQEDHALIERYKNDPARMSQERRGLELEYDARLPRPSFERIVDHIGHAVKVAGADHVGLGSDFDGSMMPRGLEDVSKLPYITAELLRRGYSEADIVKILGGNLLRVMREVEAGIRENPR
jgi:membrane dipeptidase